MVFLAILGILDIIIGFVLVFSGLLHGSGIVFYLAIIAVLKGIYSILTATAGGFYFDLLGVIDLIAGVLLYLVVVGYTPGLFFYFGLMVILKGLYSMAIGLTSRS